MNNIPSIDAMIKAGKTLPEIQAEVRKIVAARDEAALKVQQDLERKNKIKKARTAAVEALVAYCGALKVPAEKDELTENLNKALASYENELDLWLTVLDKVPADPKSRSTLDEVSLEDALAQLRAFADRL